MKTLVIISKGKNTAIRLVTQLHDVFGEYIETEIVLTSELKSANINADLIMFTSKYIKNKSSRYIDPAIPNIIAKRVIDHKNIKEIISIAGEKEVLFINDVYESTKEAVEQLIELGLDHIRYYLYYPDCISYPQLEIAITAGEGHLAPYKPKKLIDIGIRILDIQTIYRIGNILDLDKYLNNNLILDYLRDIVEISKSIEEGRRKILESQTVLATIVNSLDYGIVFINNNSIVDLNMKFEQIFGIKKNNIIGKGLDELLPTGYITLEEGKNCFIKIGNKEVFIEVHEVSLSRKISYIISAKYRKKTSYNYNKKNISRNLHDFKDYYTINNNTLELIEKAKKYSKTDAIILIQGESGTGKEILAQAIHMNSFRNKNVFIPINMATISSNLVESELFGYEEGTFTGALKGGKVGLFEIANGGTVFIDEVGDMPLDVQAKLLRVLEEKRIRRIGSVDEIPIDVRIIAATNKNLLSLVEEGKFRLDLFFRLNILPLETIPLRNRKEDIEFLLRHFININLQYNKIESLDEFLEKDVINFLNNYEWIGNVRELINLVQYLVLISEGKRLGLSSLHSYMVENATKIEHIFLSRDKVWVLKQFFENNELPIGRVRLAEIALNDNIDIGEGRIRTIIKELNKIGLIETVGNMGSKITERGKSFVKEL